MADLTATLLGCQNPDPTTRNAAEQALRQAEEANFPQFMMALAQELAGEGKDINGRQLAGLHLKNLLSAKDAITRGQKTAKWKALDAAVRGPIKGVMLGVLISPEATARHTAAQACAELASIELPFNEWPEFLPALLTNVREGTADPIKVSTLECLGYTCELLANEEVELGQDMTNQMLTAIVDGTRSDRANEVRLAATIALRNGVSFTRGNFEIAAERTMIMQTVCETTQCADARVRVAAWEVIASITYQFYSKLEEYMTTLFQISLECLGKDEEKVVVSAIEFWCVLCETELEILDEIDMLKEEGAAATQTCNRYVAAGLEHLVPLITAAMAKQDEDADADDEIYNAAMASATLLSLVAQTVEDLIVPAIMPFVMENIKSENWRLREAATMAFAQILDGPSTEAIGQYVNQSVTVLLEALTDTHPMVKSTAAFSIGKICDLHVSSIPQDIFPNLVQSLLAALPKEAPAVASQACTSLHNLAAQFLINDAEGPSNALSPYMGTLLQTLLQVSEREGWDEANLRVSAYETVNVLIQCSAQDCQPILMQMLPVIIDKLASTFAMQCLTNEDRENKENLQGLLCSVIQVTIQKIQVGVAAHADLIMQNLLQVLQSKTATAHEEAFLAIGALANVIDSEFEKYMPHLHQFLMLGLRNHEAYQVCSIAVGLVGDTARALESKIQPYCSDYVTALLENLQNPMLNRAVKPPVLSAFGDIALAIGGQFEPYMQVTLMMLIQAQATRAPDDDEELIEYVNVLREGILEAYTGIIQGLKDGNKVALLAPYAETIIGFLELLANDPNRDEDVLKAAIGCLGDICSALGPQVKELIGRNFTQTLVEEGLSSGDPIIVETAQWAASIIQQIAQS
mmetsp:Transcript_26976/g.41827  ORF Transcript_26976/g.41827 Transcript_26976/m.41827 type:complete len:863 (-) Transcript_26976:400-2988(-)